MFVQLAEGAIAPGLLGTRSGSRDDDPITAYGELFSIAVDDPALSLEFVDGRRVSDETALFDGAEGFGPADHTDQALPRPWAPSTTCPVLRWCGRSVCGCVDRGRLACGAGGAGAVAGQADTALGAAGGCGGRARYGC